MGTGTDSSSQFSTLQSAMRESMAWDGGIPENYETLEAGHFEQLSRLIAKCWWMHRLFGI